MVCDACYGRWVRALHAVLVLLCILEAVEGELRLLEVLE